MPGMFCSNEFNGSKRATEGLRQHAEVRGVSQLLSLQPRLGGRMTWSSVWFKTKAPRVHGLYWFSLSYYGVLIQKSWILFTIEADLFLMSVFRRSGFCREIRRNSSKAKHSRRFSLSSWAQLDSFSCCLRSFKPSHAMLLPCRLAGWQQDSPQSARQEAPKTAMFLGGMALFCVSLQAGQGAGLGLLEAVGCREGLSTQRAKTFRKPKADGVAGCRLPECWRHLWKNGPQTKFTMWYGGPTWKSRGQGMGKAAKLFKEPQRVTLRPIYSLGRLQEPTDEAIVSTMYQLSDQSDVDCIALLTGDTDYISTIVDLQRQAVLNFKVIIPADRDDKIRIYRSHDVEVLILGRINTEKQSRVRAILHSDGTGSVHFVNPHIMCLELFSLREKVSTFLADLGYLKQKTDATAPMEYTLPACAKFCFF